MTHRFTRTGKQVLLYGEHFADATDEIAAMMILNALRGMDERDDSERYWALDADGKAIEHCSDPFREFISNPSIVIQPKHVERREGDEHACSCGLRWGVDEDDPHGTGER